MFNISFSHDQSYKSFFKNASIQTINKKKYAPTSKTHDDF